MVETDKTVTDRLGHDKIAGERTGVAERLMAIGRRSAQRPPRDGRTPEEIIGYAERGVPR